MEIKAAHVMKLRKMTGAGMMDCKNALMEAEGAKKEGKPRIKKAVKASLDAEEAAVADVVAAVETPYEEPATEQAAPVEEAAEAKAE